MHPLPAAESPISGQHGYCTVSLGMPSAMLSRKQPYEGPAMPAKQQQHHKRSKQRPAAVPAHARAGPSVGTQHQHRGLPVTPHQQPPTAPRAAAAAAVRAPPAHPRQHVTVLQGSSKHAHWPMHHAAAAADTAMPDDGAAQDLSVIPVAPDDLRFELLHDVAEQHRLAAAQAGSGNSITKQLTDSFLHAMSAQDDSEGAGEHGEAPAVSAAVQQRLRTLQALLVPTAIKQQQDALQLLQDRDKATGLLNSLKAWWRDIKLARRLRERAGGSRTAGHSVSTAAAASRVPGGVKDQLAQGARNTMHDSKLPDWLVGFRPGFNPDRDQFWLERQWRNPPFSTALADAEERQLQRMGPGWSGGPRTEAGLRAWEDLQLRHMLEEQRSTLRKLKLRSALSALPGMSALGRVPLAVVLGTCSTATAAAEAVRGRQLSTAAAIGAVQDNIARLQLLRLSRMQECPWLQPVGSTREAAAADTSSLLQQLQDSRQRTKLPYGKKQRLPRAEVQLQVLLRQQQRMREVMQARAVLEQTQQDPQQQQQDAAGPGRDALLGSGSWQEVRYDVGHLASCGLWQAVSQLWEQQHEADLQSYRGLIMLGGRCAPLGCKPIAAPAAEQAIPAHPCRACTQQQELALQGSQPAAEVAVEACADSGGLQGAPSEPPAGSQGGEVGVGMHPQPLGAQAQGPPHHQRRQSWGGLVSRRSFSRKPAGGEQQLQQADASQQQQQQQQPAGCTAHPEKGEEDWLDRYAYRIKAEAAPDMTEERQALSELFGGPPAWQDVTAVGNVHAVMTGQERQMVEAIWPRRQHPKGAHD